MELSNLLATFVVVRLSIIAAHDAAHAALRTSREAHVYEEAREAYGRLTTALIEHDEQGKRVFGPDAYVDAVLAAAFPDRRHAQRA